MFRYCETKVEHFAPYLLKDGLVLRITKYLSNQENAEEVKITNYGGGDYVEKHSRKVITGSRNKLRSFFLKSSAFGFRGHFLRV